MNNYELTTSETRSRCAKCRATIKPQFLHIRSTNGVTICRECGKAEGLKPGFSEKLRAWL